MNETRELAKWVADIKYGELPPDVVEHSKMRLLDTLGTALWGSRTEWGRAVVELVLETGAKGESTVFGQSWKTKAQLAALANGTMSHGFELDDYHVSLTRPGHIGAVIVPATLALGEERHISGKDFILALVVGYEVLARAGKALGFSRRAATFHRTGINGPYGAAAAAAKILGLSQEQVLNAFGIAGSLSSGLMEFSQDEERGMVKRLHAGRAAEGGITASLLAQKGFTGPSTVIEGKYGHCSVFSDAPMPGELTADLGQDFEIRHICTKPYGCCGAIHPAIYGVATLASQQKINGKDVAKVVVAGGEKLYDNLIYEPKSIMALQYSMPASVALTLLKNITDPYVYSEETLRDQEVMALAKKVELAMDPEFEASPQGKRGSKVTIRLVDGREYTITVTSYKGLPQNPVTPEEIADKFMVLASPVLTRGQIGRAIEMVKVLEGLKDLRELTGALKA